MSIDWFALIIALLTVIFKAFGITLPAT